MTKLRNSVEGINSMKFYSICNAEAEVQVEHRVRAPAVATKNSTEISMIQVQVLLNIKTTTTLAGNCIDLRYWSKKWTN